MPCLEKRMSDSNSYDQWRSQGGGIRGIPPLVEEKSKKMASKMAKNGVNFKFFSPAAPIGTVGDLFT